MREMKVVMHFICAQYNQGLISEYCYAKFHNVLIIPCCSFQKKRGNIQLGLTVSQIRAAAHFEWHILPQPCCSGTTYSPGFVTQSPQTSIGHCNVLLHFKACLLLPQKHFSHTYRFSPTPTDFHLHLSDCSLEVSSYFCSSQGKMLCLRHERKPVQRQA